MSVHCDVTQSWLCECQGAYPVGSVVTTTNNPGMRGRLIGADDRAVYVQWSGYPGPPTPYFRGDDFHTHGIVIHDQFNPYRGEPSDYGCNCSGITHLRECPQWQLPY